MKECGLSVSADVWGMLYTSARRWRMCTHTPLSRKHFSLSLFLSFFVPQKSKTKIVCVCVCVCVYICLYRKRISRRAAAGQHVLQRNNKAATRRQQGDNKAAKARGRQINKASNEMQIENRLPKRERPREKEGNLFKTKIQPHEKRISCCSQ